MTFNYEPRFYRLFRFLTKNSCTICRVERGHLPHKARNAISKTLSLGSHPLRLIQTIWRKLSAVFSTRFGLIKPFDVVFAAGGSSMRRHPQAKKIVPVNVTNYENFREALKSKERLVPGRYGVFLDDYQPYHPDTVFLGLPLVDAERYYRCMNRFFGLVEQRFGCPVVIAAHPKAHYSPDRFEGRPIWSGKTLELVKDAEFAICHRSASMSYAVLAGKPLLFVYTQDLIDLYDFFLTDIQDFSGYLGSPILNVDQVSRPEQIALQPADLERYEDFKYEFLTSKESEHDLTRDIILREFGLS
jgi:hypothetical protein